MPCLCHRRKGSGRTAPKDNYDMLRTFREFSLLAQGDANHSWRKRTSSRKPILEYFGTAGERTQMMFNSQ